jgi:lipoprotein-anchoring transpeptidase ErfK/SrfK
VFATLVSTGKPGHETPTGLYRIQSKHVSTTMDDDASEDGAYSIEDVPWTMYFHGNYALHGAFWHYTFGRVRSHGCVNLAPADARWLFQWSSPTLPASWHGIFADPRQNPGTFVFIEE